MDLPTIEAYDREAATIAALHASLYPESLYRTIEYLFHPGGITADIGCGSGRDSAWLSQRGYPVTGYDASVGMISEARQRHPGIPFLQATLPKLAEVPEGGFDNVLCSAVLMHLHPTVIPSALARLLQLAGPGGVLLLSFRDTTTPDGREAGKLYTSIDPVALTDHAISTGASLLYAETTTESHRHLTWQTLAFKTPPPPAI
jgi:SAM-dependent methyltransferase